MSRPTKKRFWKDVTLAETENAFGVNLDARPIRTPAKALLELPTLALAQEVAAEWDRQGDKLDPGTMPFTRMANSAIDKVTPAHPEVVAMVAEYGGNDLLCYRAERPETLVQRQGVWDEVLDWAAADLGVSLRVTSGVVPIDQDTKSLARLRGLVAGFTAFELTGFHDLVSLSGSLILGLATEREFLDAERAWQLSRIDENWQAEQWGRDEEADALAELKRQDFLFAKTFVRLAKLPGRASA